MPNNHELEALAYTMLTAEDILQSMVQETAGATERLLPGEAPEAELMARFKVYTVGRLLTGQLPQSNSVPIDHKAVAVWMLTQQSDIL